MRADSCAVAEHGEPGAEIAHVLHAVRDEYDGRSLLLHPGDQVTQPDDVARQQRGGRLVEQEQARRAADRTGDLELLARRQVQPVDAGARVDLAEAEFAQHGAHLLFRGAAADHAQPAGGFFHQQEVLRHREVLHEGNFLEGGADAELMRGTGIGDDGLVARQQDIAGVRLEKAAQHLDQRRLSRTVFAQHGMGFATADREAEAVQRLGLAEVLGEIADFQRQSGAVGGSNLVRHCSGFAGAMPAPLRGRGGLAVGVTGRPERCRSGRSRGRARALPCSTRR
jgi:hypothetical protein